MARSRFRDGGGGQRRANAGFTTSAWSLLLLTAVALAGCNLTTPVSPNTDGQLTGQTQNQQFVFTGTISVSAFGFTLTADDTSTVTITADVRDASGNPVPNLTTIVFSTNLGAFVTEAGLTTVATATTFNGLAQVTFSSFNRKAGTATITASLGQVASSVNVTLEPEPVTGSISAAFGSTGTGSTTSTGEASAAVPLNVEISAEALDLTGAAIVGATVRFRIITDTTDELTTNEPVEFVGSSSTTTNSSGVATALIRVQGPGDVIIEADLIDPVTNQTVSTSNQIILITSQGQEGPSIALTFSDGSSAVFSFGAPGGPATELIIAAVEDATGKPLSGATVRFTMRSDTGATAATFSDGTGVGGSVTSTTSSVGEATQTVTLHASPQTVVIRAELLDASGAVVAVSSDIIATYD